MLLSPLFNRSSISCQKKKKKRQARQPVRIAGLRNEEHDKIEKKMQRISNLTRSTVPAFRLKPSIHKNPPCDVPAYL
jgi:hypothetical protein